MNRSVIRRGSNKKILLAVIGGLILCFPGCSKHKKHEMLNFFFTGVPTLEEMERQKKEAEEKRQKKEDQKKTSATAIAALSKVPSKEKEVSRKSQTVYSHTPYADGRCNDCHRGSTSFRTFRKKASTSTFSKGGGMPGVLIAPRKKLCIKCHEHLTPNEASSVGLWLHTTAAEGDCDACHAPHQSKYPGILIDKPEGICRECHADENIMNLPDHSKPGTCLDCHNPHLGKNRKLLKKDYQEKQLSKKPSPDAQNAKSNPDVKGKEMNSEKKAEIPKSGDQARPGN